MSYSVGQLHKYAVDLYKKLEEETGQNVGFSVVSNIRLASTKIEWMNTINMLVLLKQLVLM